MATIKASTSYKKKDGTLEYDSAQKNVLWTPQSSDGGPLSVPLASITNLKQTPAASDKVALRIEAGTANYTFAFTSATSARAEQEAITDVLRTEIQARNASNNPLAIAEGGNTPVPGPAANGDGPSAAMAIAHAVRSETNASNSWSDDRRLMSNIALQESLFVKDPALRQRFEQSLRDKPEGISHAQFGSQFWSSRLHLLRAHAIEKSQTQGAYNVLAQLKETNVDGARRLNLTKEHVQALFKQHPIIKHIYNEVVPNKLSEAEFWTRFFVSRLLRKLKGERITEAHSTDAILDKYLTMDEAELRDRQAADARIPHFIDLEGNEQNHSQRRGNRPHNSMIPEFNGKAPILGVLNTMSERIMANVAPADAPAHAPIGMDEATYNELRLHDLQAEEAAERVVLDVRNQRNLFATHGGTGAADNSTTASSNQDPSSVASRYAKQDPSKVLAGLRENMAQPVSLRRAPTDAKDANATAVAQIVALLTQQRALTSSAAAQSNLSPDTLQALLLTHNTTMEFLHYFWTVLLGVTGQGPASTSSKKDLVALHATLEKSVQRIAAVADGAERERQGKINELRRAAREYTEKTGKKRRVDESVVTIGGRGEVDAIMAPTVNALKVAGQKFELAMRE